MTDVSNLGSTNDDDDGQNGQNINGITLTISDIEDGPAKNEIDYNKNVYVKYSGLPANSTVYACVDLFNDGVDNCTGANFVSQGTQATTVHKKLTAAVALAAAGAFSFSPYFGLRFVISYKVNNDEATKRTTYLYIKPPNISSAANDVAVWATSDAAGRERLTDGGIVGTVILSPNEPHYVHLYNPTGAVIQVCTLSYTTGTAPGPDVCTAAQWVDMPASHAVFPNGAGTPWHYYHNANGFGAGKWVQHVRNKTSLTVYNHASVNYIIQ
jgi:hypothetical protein